MLNIKNQFRQNDALNITSLIDVIFILLIFFMISTNFKKNSLPLTLPQSENTEKENANLCVLSVTDDELQLDGENLSLDELEAKLSALYKQNNDIALSFECDKNVAFEKVVKVLTKIQNAGITKIGIAHDAE